MHVLRAAGPLCYPPHRRHGCAVQVIAPGWSLTIPPTEGAARRALLSIPFCMPDCRGAGDDNGPESARICQLALPVALIIIG